MRLTAEDGIFAVIDDATGQKLSDVMWVDDVELVYAVLECPVRFVSGADGEFEVATEEVKVTAVRVNYAAREIHVNEPASLTSSAIHVRELHACDQCHQQDTCCRINYCAQYRCAFGEVSKP